MPIVPRRVGMVMSKYDTTAVFWYSANQMSLSLHKIDSEDSSGNVFMQFALSATAVSNGFQSVHSCALIDARRLAKESSSLSPRVESQGALIAALANSL